MCTKQIKEIQKPDEDSVIIKISQNKYQVHFNTGNT